MGWHGLVGHMRKEHAKRWTKKLSKLALSLHYKPFHFGLIANIPFILLF